MAWVKKSQDRAEIEGFWSREGEIEGKVMSIVENDDNAYYLLDVTANGAKCEDKTNGDFEASIGDVIGVSASHALISLKDMKGKNVKLISHGKKEGKKGKTFWDIEVYAEE